MVGALAATPEDVRWVFIANPHKLTVAVQKLAITGAALPQLPETAHVTSLKTT